MRNWCMPLWSLIQDKWPIKGFWEIKSDQMRVGLLMYIYLASADSTFNVAEGRYKGMPCGSWSVHLLVSFKVTTWEKGQRRNKVTGDSQPENASMIQSSLLTVKLVEIQWREYIIVTRRKKRRGTREKAFRDKSKKERKRRRGKLSQRTYPQDVHPPSLELSYPWALSSLNRKKEMEI